MEKNKKQSILKSLIPYLSLLGVVGIVFSGIWWGGGFINELKEITFDDSKQKHEVINHSETDFNPVKVFQQSDTLSKRSDTLIQQQRLLKGLILTQNNKLDSIRGDNKKKQESRNSREAKMDSIAETQKTILSILNKLDTIN